MLLTALVNKGWSQITIWKEISRQRRELSRISDFLAKDIGISRAEVEREANRHFWDYEPCVQREQHTQRKSVKPCGKNDRNCCLPV